MIEADYPETLRQMLPAKEIEKRGDELFSAQISGSTKDSDGGGFALRCYKRDGGQNLRNRSAGRGFKPPQAAKVKSLVGER